MSDFHMEQIIRANTARALNDAANPSGISDTELQNTWVTGVENRNSFFGAFNRGTTAEARMQMLAGILDDNVPAKTTRELSAKIRARNAGFDFSNVGGNQADFQRALHESLVENKDFAMTMVGVAQDENGAYIDAPAGENTKTQQALMKVLADPNIAGQAYFGKALTHTLNDVASGNIEVNEIQDRLKTHITANVTSALSATTDTKERFKIMQTATRLAEYSQGGDGTQSSALFTAIAELDKDTQTAMADMFARNPALLQAGMTGEDGKMDLTAATKTVTGLKDRMEGNPTLSKAVIDAMKTFSGTSLKDLSAGTIAASYAKTQAAMITGLVASTPDDAALLAALRAQPGFMNTSALQDEFFDALDADPERQALFLNVARNNPSMLAALSAEALNNPKQMGALAKIFTGGFTDVDSIRAMMVEAGVPSVVADSFNGQNTLPFLEKHINSAVNNLLADPNIDGTEIIAYMAENNADLMQLLFARGDDVPPAVRALQKGMWKEAGNIDFKELMEVLGEDYKDFFNGMRQWVMLNLEPGHPLREFALQFLTLAEGMGGLFAEGLINIGNLGLGVVDVATMAQNGANDPLAAMLNGQFDAYGIEYGDQAISSAIGKRIANALAPDQSEFNLITIYRPDGTTVQVSLNEFEGNDLAAAAAQIGLSIDPATGLPEEFLVERFDRDLKNPGQQNAYRILSHAEIGGLSLKERSAIQSSITHIMTKAEKAGRFINDPTADINVYGKNGEAFTINLDAINRGDIGALKDAQALMKHYGIESFRDSNVNFRFNDRGQMQIATTADALNMTAAEKVVMQAHLKAFKTKYKAATGEDITDDTELTIRDQETGKLVTTTYGALAAETNVHAVKNTLGMTGAFTNSAKGTQIEYKKYVDPSAPGKQSGMLVSAP